MKLAEKYLNMKMTKKAHDMQSKNMNFNQLRPSNSFKLKKPENINARNLENITAGKELKNTP